MAQLRETIQARHLCRTCGEYVCEYTSTPRHWPKSCHWCQRKGLVTMASCVHKTPYYIKPGPARPSKRNLDWVRAPKIEESRRSGKSTGRPKKQAFDNSPRRLPVVDAAEPVIYEEYNMDELEMILC